MTKTAHLFTTKKIMFYNQCSNEDPLRFYLESKIPEHLWGDYVLYLSNPGYSLRDMWADEGVGMLGAAIDHYYKRIVQK